MSLLEIIERNEKLVKNDDRKLSELYGTENFNYFIYSLIKMDKPKTVVELGSGLGTTTLMMAQAIKENKIGTLHTIDDGSDWDILKKFLDNENRDYKEFINELLNKYKVKDYVKYYNQNINENSFFECKNIDIIFFDCWEAGAKGCVNLIKNYLPKMSGYSHMFFDRSSTIHHAFLILEQVIQYLQKGKIPDIIKEGLTKKEITDLKEFVDSSKFTLIHLNDNKYGKKNSLQNSRSWIKIEPIDIFHHNNVENFL